MAEPDPNLGLLLACLCCLVPWTVGFAMAWAWRMRVYQFGWRGSFIPHRLRERVQNWIKLAEEE